MPISSFGIGLQKVLMFLPTTYGTSLLRNHCLRSALTEFQKNGNLSNEVMNEVRKSIDCDLYFFENKISELEMFGIIIGSIAVMIATYLIINKFAKNKKS